MREKLGKKEKFQPVHSNVSWLSWAPRTGHEAVMQHGLFACICWLKLLFVHFWCSSASLFCSCLCSLPSIQTLVFQSPSAPCLVVEPMLDPFQRERYLLQYSETFSLLKHGFWSYIHYHRIIEWMTWRDLTAPCPNPCSSCPGPMYGHRPLHGWGTTALTAFSWCFSQNLFDFFYLFRWEIRPATLFCSITDVTNKFLCMICSLAAASSTPPPGK